MFTHDLQQHWEYFGQDRPLPPEPWKAHHAMHDAEWALVAYRVIEGDVDTLKAIAAAASEVGDGEVVEGVIETMRGSADD